MTAANGKNARKRKRPVTSCGECYRRKQKCNREKPCAICINRGVPERCSYDGYDSTEVNIPVGPPPKRVTLPLSPDTSVSSTSDNTVSTTPPYLGEQIGYASANGSNFSILQKSLLNDESSSSNGDLASIRGLPDFVQYQILQVEQHLPSHKVQDRLLDIYFDQVWWWFSSIDPISFRQRWKSWHMTKKDTAGRSDKDQTYFSALLFQVTAIALQYLQKTQTDVWESLSLTDSASADKLSLKYSNSGAQIMDFLGRHDSCMTAVQHDMLRGIWLKNANRGTESWYSLSNAIRQAQELRFHLKQEPPSFTTDAACNKWLWDDELRKRIWVCLFDWDAHVALTLGRPRIINAGDCGSISLLACDIPEDTSITSPKHSPLQIEKPYLITPVIFHNSVAYMIHEMLDRGADKSTLADDSILNKLHEDMNTLLDNFSPYFRYKNPDTSWDKIYPSIPSMRLHLLSIGNTFLVALNRAHVLRRPESCEAAASAAMKILTAQEELFTITPKHKWRIYTYCFYTIDASIFLSALLLEQPETLDRSWPSMIKVALQKAIDRLCEMQEASPIAKTGVQVLQKCQDKLRKQEMTKSSMASAMHTANNGRGKHSTSASGLDDQEYHANSSLVSWIEQMDQVMLPIMEYDPTGPFDNNLWDMLLND